MRKPEEHLPRKTSLKAALSIVMILASITVVVAGFIDAGENHAQIEYRRELVVTLEQQYQLQALNIRQLPRKDGENAKADFIDTSDGLEKICSLTPRKDGTQIALTCTAS